MSSFPPSSSRRDRVPMDGLSRLVAESRGVLRSPVYQVGAALLLLSIAFAGLVARGGTVGSRVSGAGLVGGALVVAVVLSYFFLRRRKGARGTLLFLRQADPENADAALRALDLDERTHAGETPGSPDLARLHLSRRIGSISKARVREHAERRRRGLAAVTLGLGVAFATSLAVGRLRVVEGLDVLFARDGLAPVRLTYLGEVAVEVAPPDYLHKKGEHFLGFTSFDAHYGSVVTVRGRLELAGRTLVLTDGKTEVPFVDDGRDGVVAHWPLAGTSEFRVAAKFGPVRIEQSESIPVTSIPDEPPKVVVKDAPRKLELAKTDEVTLEYEASDDHGLREVHLVVRSGPDETRRVLSKLDSEITKDKGAATLRPKDKALDKAFLPVLVTVEGRDDDVLLGPKWGKSEAVTLVPVPVAQLEAERMKELLAARDAMVDALAAWDAGDKDTKARKAAVEKALAALEEASRKTHGTLAPSDKLAAFVSAQARKVRAKEKAPGTEARDAFERAVVAVDRAIGSLGTKDARGSAKKVSRMAGYVADELAAARTGKDPRGREDAQVAIDLLGQAGKSMRALGFLGEDLGGIVVGDHRRIARTLAKDDLAGAEAAARDLAARMANPVPSFMGGGGGGGGGDSHGGDPQVGDDAGKDDEDAFDAEESALDDLIKDHAQNLEALENAMREGGEELQKELQQRADKLRKLAEQLRDTRGTEGSAQSVDKMADAMERGDLKQAVKEGRKAEKELRDKQKPRDAEEAKDAEKLLEQLEREAASRAAKEGEEKLAPEVRWAEKADEKADQRRKDAVARGKLDERERKARERAEELAKQRGEDPGKEDLKRAGDAMKRAEDAMKKGEGSPASEAAKEAQRALESAKRQKESGDAKNESDKPGEREGERGSPTGPVAIPKDHAGPDEFRKRVVEGMGKPASSRVKDAVKRYTERLLQ